MRQFLILFFAVLCCSVFASSQTADELISKNIQAKGGMDAIKAIKSVRMAGRLDAAGGFTSGASLRRFDGVADPAVRRAQGSSTDGRGRRARPADRL